MKEYNIDGSLSSFFPFLRLKHKYPYLFPLSISSDGWHSLVAQLEKIDPTKDVLVFGNANLSKPFLLYMILKSEKFIDLRYFTLFSLTELWLGKDDEISSLSKVDYPYMGIVASEADTPNKNYLNVLSYVLSPSTRPSPSCRWVFYSGTYSSFVEKMNPTQTYFEKSQIVFLNIKSYTVPLSSDIQEHPSLNQYF